jgi:polysaccharide export outer membrane protein
MAIPIAPARFVHIPRGFVTLHKFVAALVIMVLTPAVQGQQAAAAQESAPESSVGLAPGDIVDVLFLDFAEATQQHLTVLSNGTIFVPYAGPVKVAGLMPEDAQQAIIDALKAKQVVNSPQVSLNVVSARNLAVLVMGQVQSPHPVPLFAPAPLSFVLNQAGGFTPNASYHVLIAHKDGSPPTDVELDRTMSDFSGMNQIVKPGDIVSVAQAGSFYVLGEFNRPGIFPMVGSQQLTLLQALSIGGGPTAVAALSKARILRTLKDGSRQEIDFDMAKLQNGKVADLTIQPDDILYVPKSYPKVLVNSWLSQSLYAVAVAGTVKNY